MAISNSVTLLIIFQTLSKTQISGNSHFNKTRINGYFFHYFHTFAKNQKFIRKIYPQNLSAKFIRKIYPQNLSAKSIRKIYPQNLLENTEHFYYKQDLLAIGD